MTTAKGQYASLDGIDLYYERHGSGEPLILLHGGLGTIDEIFGRLLPALSARRGEAPTDGPQSGSRNGVTV